MCLDAESQRQANTAPTTIAHRDSGDERSEPRDEFARELGHYATNTGDGTYPLRTRPLGSMLLLRSHGCASPPRPKSFSSCSVISVNSRSDRFGRSHDSAASRISFSFSSVPVIAVSPRCWSSHLHAISCTFIP